MKKSIKIKAVCLLLCFTFLLLCSCNSGLGIKSADGNENRAEGFAGIGYASKEYGGLFNGIVDVNVTMGEAELATVMDHADSGIYCECGVKIGDDQLTNTGIKPRGNTGYVTGVGNGRYSFRLKFNKYKKGQKLNGLDELELNNMSYDPSYVREYLAYALFSLDKGVAAPLAAFAKLYINGEYYGLYLMTESIDESFLKRAFGEADGDLYEADKGSSLTSADTSSFSLKKGTDASLSNITALQKALAEDDAEDLLDVESVLRYAAVISLICGKESYLGPKAESYYLYSDEDGEMHMIPRDLRISFGTDADLKKTDYEIDGSLVSSSVTEPYFGTDPEYRPLVSRLLENEKYKKEYVSYLKYYNDALAAMLEKLPQLKEEIDGAVKEDTKRFFDDAVYQAEFQDGGDSLYSFIKARCENVRTQLAETEE